MITTATTSREIRGPEQDGSSARPGSPSSGAQQRQENPGDLTGATFGKASSGALGNFLTGVQSVLAKFRGEELLVQEIMDSYSFNKETGTSTFLIPAGVTDVAAMKALNKYASKNQRGVKNVGVNRSNLEWYENLPKEYPTYCQERDYSQARQITITGLVNGTLEAYRTTQGDILQEESLVFSDPRDQALAAAIHACKHEGDKLFGDGIVRGSVPGFALGTRRRVGASVCTTKDDRANLDTGASGSPSSGASATVQKIAQERAQEMVDSYSFNKETGVSTFLMPAGVTDVEAMKALNAYFRKNHPNLKSIPIDRQIFKYCETLPEQYPTYCQERDYSQARQITITGVVKGTEGEHRTSQGDVLKKASLVFSDPRDQALAAAIHACKHEGDNLFQGLYVRSSVPGLALCTHPVFGTVFTSYNFDSVFSRFAASGSPSPELKKA